MQKLLVFLTLAVSLFGTSTAQAAPGPCLSATTLAALIALNVTGGCQSQDKIFSNFSYSGSDPASAINASLIFQPGPNTQDIHGWSFTNGNTAGKWLNGFTLGFTITVAPGFPNVSIIASKDQINSGLTGITNGTSVTDTQSIGTLTVNGLSTANETMQLAYGPVTTVTTSSVATIPPGSLLLKYDQEFFETGATGCPATIGFWKHHPFPASVAAGGLTIGGVAYSASDLLTILNANGGNAVVILGKQLVAALLNLAAGAVHNAAADAAIATAGSLLQANSLNLLTSYVDPSSPLGQALLAQETILDNYNSANFGTCSEGAGLNTGP